ncbi:methylated-DNA--[protein]-cysteine S-methyltransferase [Sphingomonas crusticola]|uniref:methylated-DNA--[protein]-cysteine S-methyltransferase n=1 Tax=Sphingomonas crusticola TaxID=1697973 RepID=UPI000E251052|nr:methylated-DNA--[protein]-cysteine S-methyltransferase [Sphingomonas crusticola]
MNSSYLHYHIFETDHGFAAVVWNAAAITGLRLPAATAKDAARAVLRRQPDAAPADPPTDIAAVATGVQRYFTGAKIDFAEVPLELGEPEPLLVRIYAHVRKLPWGETTTYGAVARALGYGPEVARDVGQAMARNPVPLIIPCHRVLAAGGKIGGFSAPGGSQAKARMLELEGCLPAPVKVVQKSEGQGGFGF